MKPNTASPCRVLLGIAQALLLLAACDKPAVPSATAEPPQAPDSPVAKSATPVPPPPQAPPKPSADPLQVLQSLAAGEISAKDEYAAVCAAVLLEAKKFDSNVTVIPIPHTALTRAKLVERHGEGGAPDYAVAMHREQPGIGGITGVPAGSNVHYGSLSLAFDDQGILRTIVQVQSKPKTGGMESSSVVVGVQGGKMNVQMTFSTQPTWILPAADMDSARRCSVICAQKRV